MDYTRRYYLMDSKGQIQAVKHLADSELNAAQKLAGETGYYWLVEQLMK